MLKPMSHDDFCRTKRFRFQRCTCGAEEVQRIIDETCAKFGEELKRIMTAEPASQEELDKPRFFSSKVRPNGIQNTKRIRARLGQGAA
jgi:hypothetical protein